MTDLGALTPVAVVAVLYALGLAHDPKRPGVPPRVAGGAGLVALAFALGPPLDGWAQRSLTAHMTQHVVLLTIAPALLVFGSAPRIVVGAVGRLAGRPAPSPARMPSATVPVFVASAFAIGAQSLALGGWHLPAFYDAAATHLPLHAAEHLSFFGTGLLFWWVVAGAGRERGTAVAVITVFVASLPGTLLGAFMTLSTSPWYPHYATGSFASALRDQQLAGVVMWAVGGMAYVAAGTALFVGWLRALEQVAPARGELGVLR